MNEDAQERRKEKRHPSNEALCFSDSAGWGSMSVGSVHDRSDGGIAIQSDALYPVGTQLNLEVVSNAEHDFGATKVSKGEVCRIQHRPQGGYILGVRLRMAASPQGKVILIPATPAPPATEPYVPRRQRDKQNAAASTKQDLSVSVKTDRAYARQMISICLLILAFAVLLGWGGREIFEAPQVAEEGNSLFTTSTPSVNMAKQLPQEFSSPGGRSGSGSQSSSPPPLDWRNRDAQQDVLILDSPTTQDTSTPSEVYSLGTGSTQAALGNEEGASNRLLSLGTGDAGENPVELAHAKLQRAQEAARKGNRMAAMFLSREVLDAPTELPAPWKKVAEDFRRDLIRVPETVPELPELSKGMVLSQPLSELPLNAPVVVHVDKSDFVMQVIKDGKVVWQFPIGLGIQDSTPEGIFSVGNKISLPEWYNKGNPVKGGSADNPLGDSWMGLSNKGTATPYGIHPTKQGESIGEAQSGGCIRMRPEDAERLYRMIPVGTPIVIRA